MTDEDFSSRLQYLYDRQAVKTLDAYLKALRREGNHQTAEQLKARYRYRMSDLSELVKTLKQRITQFYNHRHGRRYTVGRAFQERPDR